MTTQTELQEAQKACKAEIKKLKADLEEKTKAYFEMSCKPIFEEHPNLKSFGWTQYTPYFNDGDTCYFGVNAYTGGMYINDCFEDEDDTEEIGMPAKEIKQVSKKTADLVNSMDSDSLEGMFGEGKVVVTYKNGKLKVTTEDYSHD